MGLHDSHLFEIPDVDMTTTLTSPDDLPDPIQSFFNGLDEGFEQGPGEALVLDAARNAHSLNRIYFKTIGKKEIATSVWSVERSNIREHIAVLYEGEFTDNEVESEITRRYPSS